MSQTLPRLRMNLDFMPSPVQERPGLLIRDSFRYSDATLIIPPPLVALISDIAVDPTDATKQSIYATLGGNGDYRHVWRFNGTAWQAR